MTIREMAEQREVAYFSPYASLSSKSRGRDREEPPCDIRPVYQRDRDRILHSKAFRRLKHKTQVFLLPQGSCFEVLIDLKIAGDRSVSLSSQAETDEPDDNILQGMHFLCAEDNELNAEILMELLKIEGAECTICENGEKILEAFEQSVPGDYDMILMDVQMPVMNGYEAAKAIRSSSHELAKKIPIIAMTANAFSEDIQHSLAAGMNAHISKPVDIKTLEKTVRSIKSGGGVPKRRSWNSNKLK